MQSQRGRMHQLESSESAAPLIAKMVAGALSGRNPTPLDFSRFERIALNDQLRSFVMIAVYVDDEGEREWMVRETLEVFEMTLKVCTTNWRN